MEPSDWTQEVMLCAFYIPSFSSLRIHSNVYSCTNLLVQNNHNWFLPVICFMGWLQETRWSLLSIALSVLQSGTDWAWSHLEGFLHNDLTGVTPRILPHCWPLSRRAPSGDCFLQHFCASHHGSSSSDSWGLWANSPWGSDLGRSYTAFSIQKSGSTSWREE